MNFLNKINLIWQKINLIQRALLITVTLTIIIIAAFLVHWARKPDMRMLYQGLSPAEASKITEKISEKDIPYKLKDGGTTIYVPKENVYQLRLDMAKEGLPVGEQSGYKIFDDEKIGVSPFVQNVNLKRALEEELAKSIQMIDGVLHARVHIVNPEQRLFASEASKTTASVVLRLRPGYKISGSNISAITHLVSGSVKGLKSENVTVIDSQGRLLSSESDTTIARGASTIQDYKERVEQSLAKKAEDMLTAVLGPGRATVRVSAVIDMTSSNLLLETYEPSAKVPTKEEIKSKSEAQTPPTSAEGRSTTPASTTKDETVITEYAVGKTVEQKVDLPGKIQSLSVAAFVDLTPADVNETETSGQSAMIMQISDIEDIIKNALGLKDTDFLKVVNVKFHHPAELLTKEEPSNWPRYIAIARHASLGIMAICALLVFRIFSKARKKAISEAETKQLPGTEGAIGLLPAGEGASEPIMLRRQIANALQKNPERAKELFTSWLEEKEA